MLRTLIWYRGKPFFLHKVSDNKPNINYYKSTMKTKVYFEPVYNKRTGNNTRTTSIHRQQNKPSRSNILAFYQSTLGGII